MSALAGFAGGAAKGVMGGWDDNRKAAAEKAKESFAMRIQTRKEGHAVSMQATKQEHDVEMEGLRGENNLATAKAKVTAKGSAKASEAEKAYQKQIGEINKSDLDALGRSKAVAALNAQYKPYGFSLVKSETAPDMSKETPPTGEDEPGFFSKAWDSMTSSDEPAPKDTTKAPEKKEEAKSYMHKKPDFKDADTGFSDLMGMSDGSYKGSEKSINAPAGGLLSQGQTIRLELDGKQMEVPMLVPTLTEQEKSIVSNLKKGEQPPASIIDKILAHTRSTLK